ncbi:MAG: hypothetical protein KAW45_00135 [Thermoplasmatales archaeon]|nr:hypothetical protein [Thermoplasmatales archaeon]
MLGVEAKVPGIWGLFLVLDGLFFFFYLRRVNEGMLFITIGIGFFTWALSIKSEYLSKKIVKLTKNTQKMIKRLGITSVYENIGNIEDWRLNLRNKFFNMRTLEKPDKFIIQDYVNHHSFAIWKSLTYLDRAFFYKKQFGKKEKEQIIHQIDCLFIDLGLGKGYFDIDIMPEYQKQLQMMYDKASSLDIFGKDTIRKKRMQVNLDFLKGKTVILADFDQPIDFKKLREQAEKNEKASQLKK